MADKKKKPAPKTPTPKPRPGPAPKPSKAPTSKKAASKPARKASAPYSKAAKNETPKARETRKSKFYHEQRIHAEETGDQATTDQIYRKLGKRSHSVDANATDHAALGLVALAPMLRAALPLILPLLARAPQALRGMGTAGANIGQRMERPPMMGPPRPPMGPQPAPGPAGGIGRPIPPPGGVADPLPPSSGVRAPSSVPRPAPRPAAPRSTARASAPKPTPVRKPTVRKGAAADKEMARGTKAAAKTQSTAKAAIGKAKKILDDAHGKLGGK